MGIERKPVVRNGWVIRRDTDQDEDRCWWTGEDWSPIQTEAIFFATERDADTVGRRVLIGIDTVVDFIADMRTDQQKTTNSQVLK